MSFTHYQKYKESGVGWLGKVPDHWTPIRYKNVFQEKPFTSGCALPSGSISFGNVVFKNDEALNEATKATYQEVLSGEFLINPINLNYDLKSLRTALSAIDTCVSPAYIVLRPKIDMDRSYFKYQLHIFDLRHMKTLGAGVRQTIAFDDIGACFIHLPPLLEQTAIAAFLDQETVKIDELVVEQQRLMELLKEKRQAVISHAVTKGLNPNAPMKPSGIEWLGDIPVHWDVKRFKKIAELIDGDRSSTYPSDQDLVSEGVPFLSSKNIIGYKFCDIDLRFITPEKFALLSRGKIKEGDLAITVRGTIGHVAIYDSKLFGYPTAFINAQMMIIRPIGVSASFIHSITESHYWQKQLDAASYGTAQQQLSNGILQNVFVALPPSNERDEINAFLGFELAKFDTLIAEARHAIDLLQERRTALISAAVTGQIDVRPLLKKEAA